MTEGLLKDAFKAAGVEIQTPFKRLNLERSYGKNTAQDKPDTRFGLELFDVTEILWKLQLLKHLKML